MKGYVTLTAPPAKRRWKGVALAVVLVLVVLSMLVPLAFLLGLLNRFPYGYRSENRLAVASSESGFWVFDHLGGGGEQNASEDANPRVDDLINRFGPTLDKPSTEIHGDSDNISSSPSTVDDLPFNSQPKGDTVHNGSEDTTVTAKEFSTPPVGSTEHSTPNNNGAGKKKPSKGYSSDEAEKPCELEFGSYCLWSSEHKEPMKDSVVKRLKDQLFVARAYFPSVAKLKRQEKLSRELKQNIQDHERMLSEAISDADLPQFVEKKIQKMDQTILKAKACFVDCNNVDKKLRQILDMTEDEAHFHMKQSAFLYHLGVQTMPKSLHCLSMRLTVENFKSPSTDSEDLHAHKLQNPSLQHYAIFSRNILATSVAINSTVMNSVGTDKMVFHLLTDRQNYFSMRLWFVRNSYKKATIHVMNIEDLNLQQQPGLLGSDEFRVSIRGNNQPSPLQMRTEYISVFGPAHFLLPKIFKDLKKVVVLDDDVVVQRDLSPLWKLDMKGKVNGAVEFCKVKLGQLKSYLGSQSYDANSCAWTSGVNIVDLEKWREHDVTGIYQQLLRKLESKSEDSRKAAALPATLLAFQDLIYALDDSWVLSGLGHSYGLSIDTINQRGVLHYNGNMKPWLELGIPKYKKYWDSFLTKEERFMHECNIN